MSNILLTGMSASQASESANKKSLNFAGVLNKVLTEVGHDVTWVDPDINFSYEDLDSYDSILVGISPLTSLAANRLYGALSIIDLMWDSPKLKLFIDAPKVNQITFSIKSIHSNPESFTKSFFSYRKDFSLVTSDELLKTRLFGAVEKLMDQDWPDVIYPTLPWSTPGKIKSLLPPNLKVLSGINLDSYLLQDLESEESRRDKWVADTHKTDWAKSTTASLIYPNSPMKWNKGWTDDQVLSQIEKSIGVLISPHKKDGTWWTYRYVQALNTLTPIATEWKESSKLGDAWEALASSIEAMHPENRRILAMAQKDLYKSYIPSKGLAGKILETTIGLNNNQENNNE
jgi:hypothetical protein